MGPVLLCLDSGTTSVKAGAFDGAGRMLAAAERANSALLRNGDHVEQDMRASLEDALAALRECAAKAGGRVAAVVVTGQGDGLWPVDDGMQPVGHALTWLDGRCRALAAALEPQGALEEVRRLTGSKPTPATQSLQLLWLSRNDPDRFKRIRYALRLKEWLFLSLTGSVLAEPSVVMPVWGDWRTGRIEDGVAGAIGLSRGTDLLPELAPVGECRAALLPEMAASIGIAPDATIFLGPGDVQSTLIGLGLGSRPGVSRASIFGTSAIHACHVHEARDVPSEPPGAIAQQFALGDGYLCFHPSFNGANFLKHLRKTMCGLPETISPHYSNLILHPFFEPGGERAPVTTPFASGAAFGLTEATRPEHIAWAGREALAFVARQSHDMMPAPAGALSLGGGLAGDPVFAQFLATLTGIEVQRSTAGHAGLRGLGAIAAKFLFRATDDELGRWIGEPDDRIAPEKGEITRYAQTKYDLFRKTLDMAALHWEPLSKLARDAAGLLEDEKA